MEDINIVALINTDIESKQLTSPSCVLFDKLENLWLGSSHCELSIILGTLEYVRGLYHTHHWISRGDSFYGDHLLFSRLYDSIVEEIDIVAEKAVGVSTSAAVDYSRTISQVCILNDMFGSQGVMLLPDANGLAKKSLDIETAFLEMLQLAVDSLEKNSTMTLGIDNMLAAIYDTHEGHVYLLKQRINSEFL